MNAQPPPTQTNRSRTLLVVVAAGVVGLAVAGVAVFAFLAGPRAQFATPVRQGPGFFRIAVLSVTPDAPLSSWTVRVLEQGNEAIPSTSVASLKENGLAGFQPHIEFTEAEGADRLTSGDAFFVGNLVVGWTYTIELKWLGSGATVARADFVEPG